MSEHSEKNAAIAGCNNAISLEEAARRACRSISWVRKQRRFQRLHPAILEGRHAVEVDSLERLLAFRRTYRRTDELPRPHLRLVVDNTKNVNIT